MASSAMKELFGGAITISLPTNLIDASDLRQVPDTQEVFLYPDSEISIIVEVLQSVDTNNFQDTARFHFDSLAHDNDAEAKEILEISQASNGTGHSTPAPIVLHGTQSIRKFNSALPDEIRVLLAVYRIQGHDTDLVMTMNVPMKTSDSAAVSEAGWKAARDTFAAATQSLRIVDFGLFA
ncbi:hypothetical protein AcW1_005607 [Taiwanofungus camphoratus]|nr:hypothetical protein AcW1_005607 [Antrodia cinnamomea]